MSKIHTVTDSNIQTEVLEHNGLVLMDFWAEWCAPCRALTPTLEAIAEENPSIKICKVNVDENPELGTQFNVRSIPFIVFMKDGQRVGELIGNYPKAKIEETIKSFT